MRFVSLTFEISENVNVEPSKSSLNTYVDGIIENHLQNNVLPRLDGQLESKSRLENLKVGTQEKGLGIDESVSDASSKLNNSVIISQML